ncbi:MAG: hypothetical protein ACNA8W_21790, partial [Bradymonadaceae bacterium]
PEGTWTLDEVCTDYDFEQAVKGWCSSAQVEDTESDGSGEMIFTATHYERDITVVHSGQAYLPSSCTSILSCANVAVAIRSVISGSQATCTSASAGGCDCDITVTYQDTSDGTYSVSGGIITLDDGRIFYHCVAGSLTMRKFGSDAPNIQFTELHTK